MQMLINCDRRAFSGICVQLARSTAGRFLGQRTAYSRGARWSVDQRIVDPERALALARHPAVERATDADPPARGRHVTFVIGALGLQARGFRAARSPCSPKWRKAARVVWSSGSVGSRAASPLSFAARASALRASARAIGEWAAERAAAKWRGMRLEPLRSDWGLWPSQLRPRLSLGSAIWLCDRKGLRARFP